MKKGQLVQNSSLIIAVVLALGNSFYGNDVYAAEGSVVKEQDAAKFETVSNNDTEQMEDPSMGFDLDGVTVEAKRPNWEAKLSPGTVTVIRPDNYKGEQKTLPELLKMVPGVHVRELNGKGQYTTISVRGSTAAQVGVFVDGVLFNLGSDAAADISTIPVNNVERIEIYRGYIPARFAGTYMGGVINVVTKRPTKTNVAASLGQSSYGGYKGSLQVDAPLGDGSLMVGINREQSDGDFKYKNLSTSYFRQQREESYERNLANVFENSVLANLKDAQDSVGIMQGVTFKDWDDFVNQAQVGTDFYNNSIKEIIALGMTEADAVDYLQSSFLQFSDPAYKDNLYDKMVPEYLRSAERYRQLNDYKNTDFIAKWQNDHWMIKGTWKEIDRHMPNPLYQNGWAGQESSQIDFPGIYNWAKRQNLVSKELLTGWRNQAGNLDWGISINYLDQDKDYSNAAYKEGDLSAYWKQPLNIWSNYDSDRFGAAIDGTYKAGNNLFEFYTNWSREKLKIKGSGLERTDLTDSWFRRFRNYYEYKTVNVQLQDTITLDREGTFLFTPSVRYNAATVFGRSHRPLNNDHNWFTQEDTQKSDKVTWQLALKKELNESFTLRATGGTYFRLLNLYEIAGDGAGIIPRPSKDTGTSVYPVPEEGKQWDISAILTGDFLGADADLQLTYFGRNADNMLTLYRYGQDYMSYSNSAYGTARGVEIAASMQWRKWDLDFNGTYTKVRRYDCGMLGDEGWLYGRGELPPTYQPKWEYYTRLTYKPTDRFSVFTDVKYLGDTYKYDHWDLKESSLTTVGLGAKYKIGKSFLLIVGVNDLFNKGPEQCLVQVDDGSGTIEGYNGNVNYPLQGRSYYATVQYNF